MRLDGWTVAWICWLASFVAIELPGAIDRKPGATLSEHVWSWFSVKDRAPHWLMRRSVLGLFLVALTAHLVFDVTVLPVIIFGVAFAIVIGVSLATRSQDG
jgi:hypothetical protein